MELIDDSFTTEDSFVHFFPNLAEALALSEQVLNITVQRELERVKQTRVLIKDEVRVRVTKNKQMIQELLVDHKILTGRENLIYTVLPPDSGSSLFYARLLNDYLTEVLGRDLQILQNLLTDLFNRGVNDDFLTNYHVDFERIQEIKDFLEDKAFSDTQIFWRDLMVAKKVTYTLSPFDEERTNYTLLAELLDLSLTELQRLEAIIDFSNLNQLANLVGLTELFDLLKISLGDYNRVSLQKIDFSAEYIRRFNGLKVKNKKVFEQQLFQSLRKLTIEQQVEFQDLIDKYLADFLPRLTSPLLSFDVDQYFQQHLQTTYPDLALSERKTTYVNLQQLYGQHLATLKDSLEKSALPALLLEEFLNYNKNRSLLYFGQVHVLQTRYKTWMAEHTEATNIINQPEGLDTFINRPGTTIQPGKTSALEVSPTSEDEPDDQNGSGGGKRPDGGESSSVKQLIGLVSEKMVYELLKTQYQEVEWVSKNAAKAKVNIEGHDKWGFDIQYVDEKNHVHYVEVKGKFNERHHFFITNPEVRKAHREKEFYHVFFVTHALDNDKRDIRDLGNIFMLNGLEDIFKNQRFTAKFTLLEITFK